MARATGFPVLSVQGFGSAVDADPMKSKSWQATVSVLQLGAVSLVLTGFMLALGAVPDTVHEEQKAMATPEPEEARDEEVTDPIEEPQAPEPPTDPRFWAAPPSGR